MSNARQQMSDALTVAVRDAMMRLAGEARKGRTPDYSVWLRPSYDGKAPCAPYIGDVPPSDAFWKVENVTVSGWDTESQTLNALRDASAVWPCWAMSFIDSVGYPIPSARGVISPQKGKL